MKFNTNITLKQALNLIYTISGTLIICFLIFVMSMNFFKDSRVFGKNIDPNSKRGVSTSTPSNSSTLNVEQNDMTINAEENDNQGIESTKKPVETPSQEPEKATPLPTQKTKILVRIINYTGDASMGEQVRTLLEQNGYLVASETGISSGRVSTKIIDMHSGDFSNKIFSLLNIGKIMSDYDPNSKYDVVVILGDDFVA
jgi:hypothetical protein